MLVATELLVIVVSTLMSLFLTGYLREPTCLEALEVDLCRGRLLLRSERGVNDESDSSSLVGLKDIGVVRPVCTAVVGDMLPDDSEKLLDELLRDEVSVGESGL